MKPAMIQQIKNFRLFEGIREEDIPHMLTCIGGFQRTHKKGDYIFMEGDDLQWIGLIMEGNVHMLKEDVWGDKMLLVSYGAGAVFGESFVCNDHTVSTVSFVADSDCSILFLPFRRLLKTCGMACQFHQRLIGNMIVMIADKNVHLMNKMEILSKKTIRGRILTWLSQEIQNTGTLRFVSTLGRLELAEFLCVDRSALTRELTNMKKEGILDFHKNTFELKSESSYS